MNSFHRKGVQVVIMISAALSLSNCGSIKNGKTQELTIHANVPNATVYLDGEDVGAVAEKITIKRRRKDYQLAVLAPGYTPYQAQLKSKLSNTFYGNILLGGGPIGMIVDACTGGCWEYDKDMTIALYKKGSKEANIARYYQQLTQSSQKDKIVLNAPKKQRKKSTTSGSSSRWSEVAATVAGAVVTSAVNAYLTPNSGNVLSGGGVVSGSSQSSGSRRSKPNVTYWEPCSYCYGGSVKGGFSTGVCPKCFGKGKIERVDWSAMP